MVGGRRGSLAAPAVVVADGVAAVRLARGASAVAVLLAGGEDGRPLADERRHVHVVALQGVVAVHSHADADHAGEDEGGNGD